MHGVAHRRMCAVVSGPGRPTVSLLLLLLLLLLLTLNGVMSSPAEPPSGTGGGSASWMTDSPHGESPAASSAITCEVARMKCAFREGCGMALQNYMVGCADVMSGRAQRCSVPCERALIALTSTDEGQELMRCDCQGQEFCEATKTRVEICRPEVMRANAAHSVVSCSIAQWICAADPLCSTALDYYRQLCRSMFHGKKCTPRCKNSIAILNRQEKATKLKSCVCDGSEDYDCETIKLNMDRLCFHKPPQGAHPQQQHRNEIQGDSPVKARPGAGHSGGGGTAACAQSSAVVMTLRTRWFHSLFLTLLTILFGLWHRELLT